MAFSKARRLADLMAANDAKVPAAKSPDVATARLADDSVTSAKIDDNAVVTAAIANDAVTGAKLNPPLVQGDIIYADGTDTITRLAKGTAAQVLTMNGGATAPSWANAAAGGLELQTTPKTANFTAVAGERYLCNTSGGAFTMTFPSSPSAGDTVGVVDYNGNFDTNNLTLAQASSKKILRVDANATIDTKNWSTDWVFIDDTVGWLPVG